MNDDDLVSRASAVRVVVVGGGMSGLVAALQCARLGFTVTVLEATSRLGGVVRSAGVGDLVLDTGAESYATRGGHVRALVDELGLGDDVVTPAGGRAWIAGVPGGAVPLPAGGVLGIPANPFADDVRRILGWGGAWRAYLDRIKPVLTIGHQHSLGQLVRSRLGDKVVERLVAPVTSGVYSAHPDDIDVDVAVPGLNAALTRTGSLLGAVAVVEGQRRSAGVAPGSAVEGIAGGMTRLVAALEERLGVLGATVRRDAPVAALTARDGGWHVTLAPSDDPDAAATAPQDYDADVVIVATTEAEARRLLAPVVPGLSTETGPAPVVEIVTLLLEAPALDAVPRGNGVLTVPGSSAAKALTHSSAKWEWVAKAADGRHVVRVSFGTQDEAPATEELDDDDAVALALAEASALLGVPLEAASLVAGVRERFVQAQPGSALGQAEAAAEVRAAVAAMQGLGVVGAWLAGTGLAQVVPDALAEGDRVRHAALWQ